MSKRGFGFHPGRCYEACLCTDARGWRCFHCAGSRQTKLCEL